MSIQWVSVDDELPPEGNYVLVHLTKDDWRESLQQEGAGHGVLFAAGQRRRPEGAYCKVAKLRRGISLEDREAMKLRGKQRSATVRPEEEYGNNHRPYKWQSFGPDTYLGQEVDYWMHIPSLP